ncbi:unnamed protein product [Microthlaspi erraticum]|uniref:F-box domain-containing protein n=1 Tax=Microthlaspi erraticum TaxID=1685480 RepID=A0A6D2HJR8_9BRAS|nr:unnamed protein product [Microthlaspi erraticum]
MENLEQQDLLLTTQSSNSEPIPYDLLLDIFSRVPGKSIARFRCLSKSWRSKLGLPYFTELFLTKSLALPRILFAMQVNKELLFFSSPQPQNPVDNSSLVATRYKPFLNYYPAYITPPVHGLVSLHQRASKEWVIYI